MSLSEHYKVFGPIHERIKDLRDGTRVKFEVTGYPPLLRTDASVAVPPPASAAERHYRWTATHIDVGRLMTGEPAPRNEMSDSAAEEFRRFLAEELSGLHADVRVTWERYAVTPVRMVHTWDFGGRTTGCVRRRAALDAPPLFGAAAVPVRASGAGGLTKRCC
jgi:hypothetical protein